MGYVKNLNKKTGVTYVYESRSYWDPDLKAPRSHRTLVGKIMPGTTEMIPTGTKGGTREKKSVDEKEAAWKARKAQEDLEKAEGSYGEAPADYKLLYEEALKSFEAKEKLRDMQIRELRELATEQARLLTAVSGQVAEILTKTRRILFSLEEDQ